MHVYEIRTENTVPSPLAEVFAFFSRPENLAEITPRGLGFQILTPSPVPMKEGALIDYTIRLGGLPMRWRSLITTYEPPHRFVDEQLEGPYSFWHHTHEFEATPEGTILRDHVRYALPLGVLGRFAHWLFVRRQLLKIFAYREQVIAERFGSAARRGRLIP